MTEKEKLIDIINNVSNPRLLDNLIKLVEDYVNYYS